MLDDLQAFRDELLSFARYGNQEMIGWILSAAIMGQPLEEDLAGKHDQRLYDLCVRLLSHLGDITPTERSRLLQP